MSDDENTKNPIVGEILSVWDEKEKLVSKSMEAWWLEYLDELLTDAIHKSAVVISETGEEINTVPVESTSDTTISTAKSDSDLDAELVIVQRKEEEDEVS